MGSDADHRGFAHAAPPDGSAASAVFRLALTASDREIGRATRWVEDIAARVGLPPPVVFALQLCLEEAVSNIARHGAGAAEMPVRVCLRVAARRLTLRLDDPGPPFDPSDVPAPVLTPSLDDTEIGGLGVHLIRHFSAAQHYARVGGRNRLTLFFDR